MLQQPFRCRLVCACVKLRQQRGAPPPPSKLCIRRPTLSSHRRLHHSPPKPSASSRPFSEAFNSKAASPRRRRLRHQHPLPALHDTHCSHAPHIATGMRRHPGRACCCCLSSKRCPPLLWRVNLKLHTAARGAAGGAAAPHAAPAFGLQKLARFAGEGAKGGRAAGGERRRGEKGRGCGDAQQQVLMASGWWRVQLSEVYKRCRSMCALHISPPLLGSLPPQK